MCSMVKLTFLISVFGIYLSLSLYIYIAYQETDVHNNASLDLS